VEFGQVPRLKHYNTAARPKVEFIIN